MSDLTSDVLKDFADIVIDTDDSDGETTVYGTTVESDGVDYVKIDGSSLLTPIVTTADIKPGERVLVMIKNHQAIIIGNSSNPSAGKDQVNQIQNEVVADQARIDTIVANEVVINESLNAHAARIDDLVATNVVIEGKLTADRADIDRIDANKIDADEADIRYAKVDDLTATNADIVKLNADYAKFKDASVKRLDANEASIKQLDADKLNASDAAITYLTVDNAKATYLEAGDFNAYKATVETLLAAKASIEELEANYLKVSKAETTYAKITELDALTGNFNTLNADLAKVEELVAKKATIEDLNAANASIQTLQTDLATANQLIAKKVDAEYVDSEIVKATKTITDDLTAIHAIVDVLDTKYATIEQLNAAKANLETLIAKKATIEDLNAANANISNLEGLVANINTILSGSIGTGTLQTIHLTANNVVIDDAIIKSANIEGLDVSKLNAGTISTDKFVIQSNDGGILIRGSTQQFKDKNGKVRLQIGKDAQGNFNFIVFGEDGTTAIYNQNGITQNAVPDGLIVDKMVADDANIQGKKLDINSVIDKINEDGSKTIKSTKIWIDEENQSLGAKFDTINTNVQTAVTQSSSAVSTANSAKTTANTANSNASTALTKANTAIEDSSTAKTNSETAISTANSAKSTANTANSTANTAKTTADNALSKSNENAENIETLTTTVSTKVSQTDFEVEQGRINSLISTTETLQTSVSNAQSTANNAQTTANSKAKVFTSQPTPPYSVGDLWVQGSSGEIMKCKTARASGSYTSSDWEKASKYTDDTKANQVQSSLTTLTNKYNQTVQTVEGNKTTIANVQIKVNDLTGDVESMDSRITTVETTADGLKTTVSKASSDASSALTSANQTATKFSWIVKSGSSATDFTLTDRTASLVADYINLNGKVTFSGLDSSAQNKINNKADQSVLDAWNSDTVESDITTINGGYIRTNSITTNQLDTNEIYGNSAFIGAIQATRLNADMITAGTIKSSLLNLYGFKMLNKTTNQESLSITDTGSITMRGSIESYNYHSGKTGWAINSTTDDAEFNNVTVRGSVITNDGGIVSAGGSGRNLQLNTSFYNGLTSWSREDKYSVDTGFQYKLTNTVKFERSGLTSDSIQWLYSGSNAIRCTVGKSYTAQANFYTKDSSAIDGSGVIFGIYFYTSDSSSAGTFRKKVSFTNNQWVYETITAVAPQNAVYVAIVVGAYRNGTFWMAHPKLEEGDVATDWSLAPEDKIKQVRFWAGTSYDERESAPFIVYNDGSIKATQGNFSGVFSGTVDIGNIKITDPSATAGGDALLTIQNGNNGIKKVQLKDTEYSSFAQNLIISDNTYNTKIELNQNGYGTFKGGVNVNNKIYLEGSHLVINGRELTTNDAGFLFNSSQVDIGTSSNTAIANIYGQTNVNGNLKVTKKVNYNGIVETTIGSDGIDFDVIV